MSSLLKKVFSVSSLALATIPVSTVYAEVHDAHNYVDFKTDIWAAANALAHAIREDVNKNHNPIPGHDAYKNLKIVSVDEFYQGTFEVDDNTKFMKHFSVDNVSFQAEGVPLFSKYAATLNMSVELTPECDIVEGSRNYVVVKSNSSLVDALFKKDLTGRNYNPKYQAYGDEVFKTLLETEGLKQFCKPR